MTRRAFIVCGAESSGNRLVTAYLVRAGCHGSGSHLQPTDADLETTSVERIVIIRHGLEVGKTIPILRERGYDITAIVVIREESALLKSQVDHHHFPDVGVARVGTRNQHREAFRAILDAGIDFIMLPLEALVLHPIPVVRRMLERVGLPVGDPMELIKVDLVSRSPIPYDPNGKRYYTDTQEPQNTLGLASGLPSNCAQELTWWPQRGMGYYPVVNYPVVYDESYWDKYQGYNKTEMGQALTEGRLKLVRGYLSDEEGLIDIGIGSGAFVQARAGVETRGYDVNPKAVAWLKERGLWGNPYTGSPRSLTCWDSLEHIPDPTKLIDRAGFYVFVSMPIFTSAEHCLASKHFRPDEHFWYFTREGLISWFKDRGFVCLKVSDLEMRLGREDILSFVFRRTDWEALSLKELSKNEPEALNNDGA